MRRKILLILTVSATMQAALTQPELTHSLNAPRIDDIITKQQVTCQDAGNAGKNVLWNFSISEVEIINDRYEVRYISPRVMRSGEFRMGEDTFQTAENLIVGYEYKTNYFYQYKDSILYLLGYQNRSDLMKHFEPLPHLKFPFSYGDRIECNTRSKDIFYQKIPFLIHGYYSMQADGYGTIILPTSDTLKEVLRIHTIHHQLGDSIREMDSIFVDVTTENYRWYARGYRYPVFETVRSAHKNKNEEIDILETAFMYPPQNQEENKDIENAAEYEKMLKEQEQNTNINDIWAGLTYNVYPNPVQDDLHFELYLPKAVNNLRIQLHTKMGFIAIDQNRGSFSQGTHRFEFNVSSLKQNTHYILDFYLDGYLVHGAVVLKK
ncbi:MAG: hypothetical protein LBG17_03125 [Bacteroidales bacterium]|jgi:hypothetical protein|nr:hypothetical protein [Bacteroidales bacterium]